MFSAAVYCIFVLSLVFNFSPAFSSEGDRSWLYQKCVQNCINANCTEDGSSFTTAVAALQDLATLVLRWSCLDDCRYHCMWRTVHAFEERGMRVPKFHGKWPFKRLFGVQEPASAAFSILNMAAHIYMVLRIRRDRRLAKGAPMLVFWKLFTLVCVHAWLWSAVFHARDTPLTEFMDYACALSMVMALFVAAVIRMLRKHRVACSVVLSCAWVYYIYHARYLYHGYVDYSYNMAVNVCFGVAGSVIWLLHAMSALLQGRNYAWRMVAFTLASGAGLLLELIDFPPVVGVDAHALWHLSTAPLPLLFYRFVIDDMVYLKKVQIVKTKSFEKIT